MADILKKIIAADTARAQLFVRFYTEANQVGFVSLIDVPLQPDGAPVLGTALDDYISGFRPSLTFDREALLAARGGAPELAALVVADHVPPPPPPPGLVIGREAALVQLNNITEIQRGLFLTQGRAGEAIFYYTSVEQARAYKAAGYSGTVPPIIQAVIDGRDDVGETVTAQQVTDAIIDDVVTLATNLARIERVRVKWRRTIILAPAEADFAALLAEARTEIEAIL